MTVNEALLRSTDDATIWAREFKKIQPDVDEDLMIVWFANAIESAKDRLIAKQIVAVEGAAAVLGVSVDLSDQINRQ